MNQTSKALTIAILIKLTRLLRHLSQKFGLTRLDLERFKESLQPLRIAVVIST